MGKEAWESNINPLSKGNAPWEQDFLQSDLFIGYEIIMYVKAQRQLYS